MEKVWWPWIQTTKLPSMRGGREEALIESWDMDKDMDEEKKKEAMDPIMME
jgi:hypothetical protein